MDSQQSSNAQKTSSDSVNVQVESAYDERPTVDNQTEIQSINQQHVSATENSNSEMNFQVNSENKI